MMRPMILFLLCLPAPIAAAESPRVLSLDDALTSSYLIRKAHQPGQLSTLEATCAALAQLEGQPTRFGPLLAAFDGFVAQQLSLALTGRQQATNAAKSPC